MPEFDESPLAGEVRRLLDDMYGAYLAGESDRIDVHLAERFTIFDSAERGLVRGAVELAALRGRRGSADGAPASASAPPTETALRVGPIEARTIGGVVIAAFELTADAVDADGIAVVPEISRNTVCFERVDGRLRIVHLHEDVWQRFGAD